jgi:hypothetical protein
VPEPDISLHFLIQRLKILNELANKRIQDLTSGYIRRAAGGDFSSTTNGVSGAFQGFVKTSEAALHRLGLRAFRLRIRYQPQSTPTCKINQQNVPDGRFGGSG